VVILWEWDKSSGSTVGMVKVCSIPVVMGTTSDSSQKFKTDVKKKWIWILQQTLHAHSRCLEFRPQVATVSVTCRLWSC